MAVKNITTTAKPSEDTKAFCVYLISPIYLEYAITRSYKKFCGFSGLRPMRPCVSGDISRASSRIFPATPIRACLVAG